MSESRIVSGIFSVK